jgi:hypothetical protein
LKALFLFFAVFLTTACCYGQSGYNYHQWGAALGFSYQRGYTNITHQYSQFGANGSYIYFVNPFFPIEAEFQCGKLAGGGPLPSQDPYGREYHNKYQAVIIHGDIMLDAAIDYEDSWILNVVKNFYGGAGIGAIFNHNQVTRYSIYVPPYPQSGFYRFPGKDSSINLTIPLRFGYEFKIYNELNEPRFLIDITYIHNVIIGEGLDGYDDPSSKFKNNAPDQYRQINVTLKYCFGNLVSYNKIIRPYRYRVWRLD